MTTPRNRREQQALDALLALIADGIEYPDAEWKACQNGMLCDASRLQDLYDHHCANK
jgi:hypothetical protein